MERYAKKKAQSILEYVLLFSIVAAAATLSYKYIYRSMNARLIQIQDQLIGAAKHIYKP